VKKNIILITNSYPYSIAKEDEFVEPELEILKKYFNIKIIPLNRDGFISYKYKELNLEIIENIKKPKKICLILYLVIYFKELFKSKINIKNLKHIKDLLSHFVLSKWFEKELEKKIKNNEIPRNSIFYTYWFDYATTALINLKEKYNIKVITRTHGYDLYEEQRRDGFIPFRNYVIKKIDYVITVSKNGMDYIKKKYHISNVKCYYLGINDRNIENPINNTNFLNIVSCSYIVPVKRVEYIMNFLNRYSLENKTNIAWYHIGGGNNITNIINFRESFKNSYFKIIFLGELDNKDVYKFYNNNPIDLSLIHISEPTRLGMISYAVFCLKRKRIGIVQNRRH